MDILSYQIISRYQITFPKGYKSLHYNTQVLSPAFTIITNSNPKYFER